jgi:predicted DCC family thiol-disulfide oxidoreductase YuxK
MCKVCTRLASTLRKWDRHHQIEVIPSQTSGVMARFPWIPARAYAEALQLIGPGGQTWQGAAAIEQLLNILPKGKLVAWLFSIPFVRVLADRFYRWFARNRYRLGCGEHCQSRPLDVAFRDS